MLHLIKKLKPLLVAFIAWRSFRERRRYASGQIDSTGGATTVHRPLLESVDYIFGAFDDFNRYAGLTPERVRGKRIVELGPGDNLGVGLLYIAWGAAEYVGMDRFYSTHDLDREREIYLALRQKLPPEQQVRFDQAIQLDKGIQFNDEVIRYQYGSAAEQCDTALPSGFADIILSRVVIQSVDTELALSAMNKLLAADGLMAHKIDLRDLGMFSDNGYHPLEFLTLSDATYDWMVKGADRPNRRHIPYYRKALGDLGYQTRIFRTGVVDPSRDGCWRPLIPHEETLLPGLHFQPSELQVAESIRSRLLSQYASIAATDLITAGIFLVATRN